MLMMVMGFQLETVNRLTGFTAGGKLLFFPEFGKDSIFCDCMIRAPLPGPASFLPVGNQI